MPRKLSHILKDSVIGLMIVLQIFFYPAVALADTSTDPTVTDPADNTSQSAESTPAETVDTPTDTSATTPTDSTPADTSSASTPTDTQTPSLTGPTTPTGPQSPTGPTQPNGVDGSTYQYNAATGMWENDLYSWDPVTHQTKPKTPQNYSYNPQTHMWDTTDWVFSPASGTYVANTRSVAKPPGGGFGANASISNTGPSSNNGINLNGTSNGAFDLFFNGAISNVITSDSRSGNAFVQGNTNGGNATSGDAQAIANILNMLQSTWGSLGSEQIATFIADINGNVQGDLMIDPSLLNSAASNGNVDIHVSEDAAINNDIQVSATSGDAMVDSNTNGGSATSGDATALVNLINMINSAIYANQSFVGILNINGDLEGDILLPPGLLQAIIAATGPQSNNTINANGNTSVDVDVNTNRQITNQVTSGAVSGDATVANNTNAGSATTGATDNKLVLLNLTGKQVVAKNALVVFVNVLGDWVGLILNAPAGTNAVVATGAGSTNTINSNGDRNVNVGIDENSQINNNVNVNAASGDAAATNNTNAGDAKSGKATTGVNVLNMIDSTFSVSDWFGVLFINVFGTWHGSFGVNTPYGNAPATTGGMGGGSGSSTSAAAPATSPGVFGFMPYQASIHNSGAGSTNFVGGAASGGGSNTQSPQPVAAVLTSKDSLPASAVAGGLHYNKNWTLSLVTVSAGLLMLLGERLISRFRLIS